MKTLRLFILTIAAVLATAMASCIDDDFDRSPDATIGFSTDTVSFGTVFTDLKTPTARLIVRNPNKKGIVISSIRLNGDGNVFRFNVDGVSGKEFHDVEIRGRDSIYVYLECLVPEYPGIDPKEVAAKLEFTANGNVQDVELLAVALNVRRLHGLEVEGEMTLTPDLPYVVFDSLTISPKGVLRIEPGTQLLFHAGAKMDVRGRLEAAGAPGAMIGFRGDRIDNVLPDVPYDLLAGQWQGVRFYPESFGNRLEYVDMRSTVSGLQIDSCGDLSRQKLLLVNSWLHNSQSQALKSEYANVDAYGCCFSEAPKGVVLLTGGKHEFVQCTVANNYLFAAVSEANLTLRHSLPKELENNANPLMEANFDNCIVYGIGSSIFPEDLTGSNVFMRNVLLKEKGDDDANFISCLWDTDPLFCAVREDYIFNYHLQPDSPALGAGNPAFVSPLCITDMDGVNRLEDGNPALGAYSR